MSEPFEMMVFDYAQHANEAVLQVLSGDRLAVLSGPGASLPITWRTSSDRGRTWSDTRPIVDRNGKTFQCWRCSVARLKSGKLAIVYNGNFVRPGRDGDLWFRTSHDEGLTWSDPVMIDPIAACMRNNTMRVLDSGRILCPVFNWLSPLATGESEYPGAAICWSWTWFSDDEGQTWQRSDNEVYVPGAQGACDFEEPAVEQLKDGRILMFGRTRLGRIFQSTSDNQGQTWSKPQPTQLASNYTPTSLWRIPQTGDLLCIWNQIDANEMWAGYHRMRLTCAVSKDEGETWQHFRNLESRDDTCYVPPGKIMVYEQPDYGYAEPVDTGRYHRTNNGSRICYPSTAAMGDEIMVVYDYGYASNFVDTDGAERLASHGTKFRALPVQWFYESTIPAGATAPVARPSRAL